MCCYLGGSYLKKRFENEDAILEWYDEKITQYKMIYQIFY